MRLLVDHGVYRNVGDTAQIEGVIHRLRSLLPKAEIFVIDRPSLETTIWQELGVSRQPEYAVDPASNKALARLPFFWRYQPNWNRLVSNITLRFLGTILTAGSMPLSRGAQHGIARLGQFCEPFDALHVSGGGNLTDTFPHELFRRCCLVHAFADQGKPVLLSGQQLGPFQSRMARKGLERMLERCSFVGLREGGDSLTISQESNLEPNRFVVMGDDSFGVPPADESSISELMAQYGLRANEFLAFNFDMGAYAPEYAQHLDKAAAMIDILVRHFQMPGLIVPIGRITQDSDLTAGEKLVKATRSGRIFVLQVDNLKPALVKGVVGRAFGAVGVSYHFCLFALSAGVPAVCIHDGVYYSQKARGLQSFWKDERVAISLKDNDAESAAGHIDRVLRDEQLRKNLAALSEYALERWQNIFDNQVTDIFGRIR